MRKRYRFRLMGWITALVTIAAMAATAAAAALSGVAGAATATTTTTPLTGATVTTTTTTCPGYTLTPEFVKVEPDQGPTSGGATVTINGVSFGGVTEVWFGSTPAASFKVLPEGKVQAVTPPGTGTVSVAVLGSPGGCNRMEGRGSYTYEPLPVVTTTTTTTTCAFPYPPEISRIEPDRGPRDGGTTVKIVGGGFGGVKTVSFGGANASFTVNSPNLITAITPPGTGRVPVMVVTGGLCNGQGPSEPFWFSYVAVESTEYTNWVLSGSLTDQNANQTINLPGGSTFNGSGEVNLETGAGSVKGSLSVPAFTAPIKLFGSIPASLGMTVTDAVPIEGSLTKSATTSGDETLKASAKLDVGITSVGLLGLKISTECTTSEPIALGLVDTLPLEELLKTGWHFSGTATLPRLTCQGGFLGSILGPVLTALISGPQNPYTLTISAPSV
jgi:hypothetical protein